MSARTYLKSIPLFLFYFLVDEQILRFHTRGHLERLKELFECVEASKKLGKETIVSIDSDTTIMSCSKEAIYRAAGSVIAAVDSLFDTNIDRRVLSAFCAIRPPGHHAERNKACGFCFLSNAGIAALHAKVCYGVERIAVLDFDVHHGNGTEEGFSDDPSLFYGSTHEKDNFPGTGKEPKDKGERAKSEKNRRIVNRYLQRGPKSKVEFKTKWREVVDEMLRFKPQLVIVSAGFDAHDEDPLADCELDESDFAWATMIIIDACKELNPASPVRCISVLEGGYDLPALASSTLVHVQTLFDCTEEIHACIQEPTVTVQAINSDDVIVTDEVDTISNILSFTNVNA